MDSFSLCLPSEQFGAHEWPLMPALVRVGGSRRILVPLLATRGSSSLILEAIGVCHAIFSVNLPVQTAVRPS